MAATSMVSWVWLLLLGGGMPLPLSLPPLPEDPVLSAVAPEDCLWYLTWAGSAKPDAASKNQTEQLLAEEEIQRFGSELERRIVAAIREHSNGREAIAAQEVPKLVKLVLTRPTAMFVSDFKMGQRGPDISGGLIINLGDQVDDAKASLDRLMTLLPAPPAAGDKWQRMPMPPGAPVIEWGINGKYLIVGLGEGSADGIVARQKGSAPAWLSSLHKRLAVSRPAMVHYLNIKKIMTLVQQTAPPQAQQFIDALGVGNVTSLASISGLDDTGWTSNALLAIDGQPTGIFALAGGDPLTAADLAPIPRDATFALAGKLDLEKVYRGVSSIAGKIDPRARLELEQGMAQLENHLGVDLSRDVFKSLGDTWCVYSAPSEGGLLVTGLTVVAQVRDRERLAKAEERLRTMAKAGMDGAAGNPGRSFDRRPHVAIGDFEFRGYQVHFLNFIGEPVPVSPAWCITDKEFIVALSPQTIKAHLSRKSGAPSLASVPAVLSRFEDSSGPTSLAYADTAATIGTLYPLVQWGFSAITSELQREGIQIDPSLLPSAAAILPHLMPSVSTSTMSKDGLLITRHGTLPMDFEALPLMAMPYLFLARSAEVQRVNTLGGPVQIERRAPLPIGVEISAAPFLPGGADRMQSTNKLKQIGIAMNNFHSAHRAFPAAYNSGKDGKPLLSWRVQILPYIEEGRLYEEFHLDEPWDSEHNKNLISRMPKIYAAPGSNVAKEFKTDYLVPHGDETMFIDGKAPKIQEISDGTSNTIMVVEAADDKAVIWTKPDDLEVDLKQPAKGLVGLRSGGFLAGFADGSVHFLKDTIKSETLKALFTKAGGEPIDRSEF